VELPTIDAGFSPAIQRLSSQVTVDARTGARRIVFGESQPQPQPPQPQQRAAPKAASGPAPGQPSQVFRPRTSGGRGAVHAQELDLEFSDLEEDEAPAPASRSAAELWLSDRQPAGPSRDNGPGAGQRPATRARPRTGRSPAPAPAPAPAPRPQSPGQGRGFEAPSRRLRATAAPSTEGSPGKRKPSVSRWSYSPRAAAGSPSKAAALGGHTPVGQASQSAALSDSDDDAPGRVGRVHIPTMEAPMRVQQDTIDPKTGARRIVFG